METRQLICFVILVPLAWGQELLVMTSQGLVRGVPAEDGDYSMFLGIPFAVVDPDNPFGANLSPPMFEEVFEANDDTPSCPQVDEFTFVISGNLDCLTMNIYVPNSASSENRLPVMVWFYGGGYQFGSASLEIYGPQYIVRHDVIMVALNYRLGPYGFMCVDIPSVPGNAGLKDQRAGLRWINENIEAFGGDPDSITLFGQSAGAISSEYHILSSGSNGLFNRAIIQSGSILTGHITSNATKLAPLDLAQYFGYQTEDLEEALQFIGSLETDELMAAATELRMNFRPCLETIFEGVENFIAGTPLDMVMAGGYNRVPMLMGYNDDENGLHLIYMRGVSDYMDRYTNVFQNTIQNFFDFPDVDEVEKVAKITKEFYIGVKEVTEDLRGFVDFESDSKTYPVERSLLLHLPNSDNPIYRYHFAYDGGRNYIKLMHNYTEGGLGAVHSDEIGYIFHQSDMPLEMSPEDQLVTDQITTLWTNFAKFGDPTPSVTELLPFILPPARTSQRDTVIIDSNTRVDERPFHKRMAYWDLFYLGYGKYLSGCDYCSE